MREIQLTKGKVALVDDEDYELHGQYKWSATCNPDGRRPGSKAKWYAVRNSPYGRVYLHREIMRTPRGFVVNHRCGNGLDCRRENMHNCLQKTNVRLTSKSSDDCVCWALTGEKPLDIAL